MAAQARRVVAHPHATDAPALRLWAFAILKAERGQTVAHDRLHANPASPSAPAQTRAVLCSQRPGQITACHLLPVGG
jgi:hypothetical protein